jgi:dolichol-phosphate mannosyltransferase
VPRLVVVPTFQEAENIVEYLTRVRDAAPDLDILVVDDNSPDGTADLAEETGKNMGRVDVLRRAKKEGLGNAYRDGFARGLAQGYDVIVQMDADLSHEPETLPSLLQAIDDGADIAIGARYVPGGSTPYWPLHRRMLSRYGNRYASFVLSLPVKDATSGFRAYRADAMRQLDIGTTRTNGYGFQIEVIYRAGIDDLKCTQVPITFRDRVRGTSKMSWRIIAEAMLLVTWWGIRRLKPGKTRRP